MTAIALALGMLACVEVPSSGSAMVSDLSFVVSSVDVVASVEVEEVGQAGETATVRVDSVEWPEQEPAPVPPRVFRMWWTWQDLQQVRAGDRLVVLLTHVPELERDKDASWQASYVLDDALEPLPVRGGAGDPTLTTANEELQDLYGSVSSPTEKLERLLAYVEEQR